MKWTSFALFGTSGVGKTSLLNLLLRKEPVTEHHSTPVAKAPEVRLVSKEERDDKGQVIMSDESCFWTSADPETMKIKFLQAIKYSVRTQNDETEPQELQELNEDQVKSTSQEEIESVQQTPLTSQVTPKKKPHDSLPIDHSQDKEQLQSISEVKESKEKPLLTSLAMPKRKPHDSLPTDHSQDKEQLQSISKVKGSKWKSLFSSLRTPKKMPLNSLPTDQSRDNDKLQLMSRLQESKEKPLVPLQMKPKKKPDESLPTDYSPDKEQLQLMSGVQESREQPLLTSHVMPKNKPQPTDHSSDEEQLQSMSGVQESKEKPLVPLQMTPKKKPDESVPTDYSPDKEQLQPMSIVQESKEKPLVPLQMKPKKKPDESLPTDYSPDKEQLQLMSGVQESREQPLLTSHVMPKNKPQPTDHSSDEEQLQSMSGVQESKEKLLVLSQRTPKEKPDESVPTDYSPDKKQLQLISGVQESKEQPLLTSHVMPKNKPPPTDHSSDEEQLQSISGVQESKEKPLLTSQAMPKKKPSESLSTDSTTLNKELLQLITEVKKSDELYNTHMMYGVDLGGQAAFLDIAPALLCYHSLNMVLFRLDEKLDDAANFFYSVHGRKVGEGEKRQMSTMQLTKSFFRCRSQLRPPIFKGVQKHGRPHFIVIGTCYDEYERLQENNELKESLDEKNERLHGELKNYEDVRHDYTKGKDIIFPVNNMGRGRNEEEIAERIRRITGRSYIRAEVPARWFFFQVELKSKTKGRRIISLDKCVEIGKSVGMQRKEVLAALWYFHNLSIYLHFPGILSHVVFLDPQVLFDMLSQIIAVSYGDDRYDNATIKSLKTKGMFKRELLDTMEFEEDVFSCDDFLKLMEGLLIISQIPNDTGYFIPCVLDIIDDPFEDSSDAIEPLYLTWDDELIPNGLFTSLVVLLMRHVSPTQFQLVNDVYHNKVVLRCQHFGGALHLLDQVKSLTIRYFGPSRNCFNIRRMIHQGIESIVHKFGWTDSLASTQEGFRCKIEGCTDSSFHLCHLISEHEEILCCDVSNIKCSADKTRHLSWFHEGMML